MDRPGSSVGAAVVTGSIGTCDQCRNKAEVAVYPYHPYDNPQPNPQPICESCYKENVKLEHKITESGGNRPESHNPPTVEVEGAKHVSSSGLQSSRNGEDPYAAERARYLQVIFEKADDAFVEKFITEVVVKSVLKFDWQEIMKLERWFSVLDLRKFALELDPMFDKPKKSKRNKRGA